METKGRCYGDLAYSISPIHNDKVENNPERSEPNGCTELNERDVTSFENGFHMGSCLVPMGGRIRGKTYGLRNSSIRQREKARTSGGNKSPCL